ncbi:hypothetical protein PSN45_001157 [Yamadazyma tenuis]|uniref:uncharacterized protein n=1 Tax=Candida tenuis TaxID=2315449 RepID=UPI0027981B16|nr:hypothetical protein PSN45_001157 [Yamadazyma tenuis]
MKSILIVFLTYMALVSADSSLGCYSSVSGTNKGSYQYQTSSYCATQCPNSPYVAITNGDTCYCLSKKPTSKEVDSSECDTVCTGYGTDYCGGASAFSLYAGTGTDDSEDSSSSVADTDSSTAFSAPSSSATSSSSTTNTKTTQSDESDASSVTDSPSSSSTDDTKIVTTSSGSGTAVVKTVTMEPSSTSTSASASATSTSSSKDSDEHSKKSNIGPIVGGVVGGVAALAIIGFLIFFFIRRKRAEEDDEDEEEYFDKPTGAMGGSIDRNYGTGKSKRSAKTNGLEMPMANPFTHPSDNVNQRSGELVDPRLNPIMLGRRRLSEGSLADETDYSRKILQVANPDGL